MQQPGYWDKRKVQLLTDLELAETMLVLILREPILLPTSPPCQPDTHAHYIQLIQPSPMAMLRHSLWRQEIDVWRANGLNYLARSTNFTRKWIKTGSWSGFICRSLDDEKSLKHPDLQNCYFFSILTSAFQSCCCCWGAAGCGCCCCELLPQGSSQSSETLLRAGPELKVFPLGTVHP